MVNTSSVQSVFLIQKHITPLLRVSACLAPLLFLNAIAEAQIGACCSDSYGCYAEITQVECESVNGDTWQGAGSTCDIMLCEPTGACCDGMTCQLTTESTCIQMGFLYIGDGSDCDAETAACGPEPMDDECSCLWELNATRCPATVSNDTDITPFRKRMTLTLVPKKDLKTFRKIVRKHSDAIKFVGNIDDAAAAICAFWRVNGMNALENVAIVGHGKPGNQRIGDVSDPKSNIGNDDQASMDREAVFTGKVALKIRKLTLLGCSVGAGGKGQAFKQRLVENIQLDQVKAYTGAVWSRVAANKLVVVDGEKKKEPIPTVSEWGLIVLMLLLLTAGTIIFARRRQTRLTPV